MQMLKAEGGGRGCQKSRHVNKFLFTLFQLEKG